MVVDEHGALPLPWLGAALQQALNMQKAHAILLHAAPGDGALELALSLAQSWLCETTPAGSPGLACGRCGSCRQVAARAHPDLKVLLPETLQVALGWSSVEGDADAGDGSKSKRKPSRQIRIDAVRAAIDWTATTSSRGRAKVVVIHPADALNPQSANALLKTLEEPPRGARLILTAADPERLLPTVRSRCQRLRVPTPAEAESRQWLATLGVGDAATLLRAMDGHPLDAARHAAGGLTGQGWAALPAAVSAGRASFFNDWPLALVVESLQKFCHDEMAATVGGTPRYFEAASLHGNAELIRLLAWKQELSRVARHVDHPWSEPLLVEALLATAARAWAAPGLDTLRP